MADAQQIIQDMAKYSQVKKKGNYRKAENVPEGKKSLIKKLTEPMFVPDPGSIKIENPPAGIPDEIKSVVEDIKNSSVFNEEILKGISESHPAMLKHINKFAQSINKWLVDDFNKISGEKNDLNTQYASWVESGNNFLTIVKEFEKTVNAVSAIAQTSEPIEEVVGKETEISKDSRLILAFAHMGIDIMRDPNDPNKYICKESVSGGFQYEDNQGNKKVKKISEGAAQAFIDNYLMSPDKDSVDISPKGLFTYFIQQELVGTTSKRKLDSDLLKRAQNLFSEDAPEWQALVMEEDTAGMLRDASMVGFHSLNRETLESISLDEGVSYTSELSGKQADTLRNRWRIEKLERDSAKVIDASESAIDANQTSIDNVYAKYEKVIEALKVEESLYPNGKAPAALGVYITRMQQKLDMVKVFGYNITELYSQAQSGAFKDPDKNITKDAPSNNAQFIKQIFDNLSFDATTNQITLAGDLPWISKEQFDSVMQSKTLESEQENENNKKRRTRNPHQSQAQQESTVLPDVFEVSFDQEFSDGLSFADVMNQDALHHRTVEFINNPPNWISDIYAGYADALAENPSLTGQEYIKAMISQDPSMESSELLGGFTSIEALGNSIQLCATQSVKNGEEPNYSVTPETKAVRERAAVLYYHMDMVAQEIAKDPALREEYDKGSADDKKRIFGQVYEGLKQRKALDSPDRENVSDAESRWRNYGLLVNEQQLFAENVSSPDCTKDKKNMDTMAVLGGLIKKDGAKFSSAIQHLQSQNKAVVDYADTASMGPNQSTEEHENGKQDDDLIEFKELYPREVPAFKIQKQMQPFNVKAGQKMIDKLLDAFQKAKVKSPYKVAGNKSAGQPVLDGKDDEHELEEVVDITNPSQVGSSGTDGKKDVVENEGGHLFDVLDETQIRHAAAMSAVGSGVKYIIEKLEVGEDETAKGVVDAMNYMNNLAVNEPIVSYGNMPIPLPDAMRNILLDFAAGKGTNPDGSPMSPEQQQTANLSQAKQSIEILKEQVGKIRPGMPGAENIAKYTAMLDNFAYAYTSGLLTPAEVAKLISMTSTSTMQPKEDGTIEISPGADLTPEQVATLKTCKTQEEFDKKAIEFGLYKQNIVNEVYGDKQEAQASTEAGRDISENLP